MAKLSYILDVMKKNAVLHLSFAPKRPSWQLINPAITVNSRMVQAMIKREAIAGSGDTLFDAIPSQTWRYCPHLNWKQGKGKHGKNTYAALGQRPGGGKYIIRWMGDGYCVEFHISAGRGSVSHVGRIPKLEDAKALAELHRDKRRELIRTYGDKRNVPHEAWMKFRAELQESARDQDDRRSVCPLQERMR